MDRSGGCSQNRFGPNAGPRYDGYTDKSRSNHNHGPDRKSKNDRNNDKIAMTSLERKNKEVAKWLELCWHEFEVDVPWVRCSCKKEWYGGAKIPQLEEHKKLNPNFISDPLALLRLMREREDWPEFIDTVGMYGKGLYPPPHIRVDLILDTTGNLLEAVWEWLKQNENDPK